jgi:glucosamine-6-phosphate deaminase
MEATIDYTQKIFEKIPVTIVDSISSAVKSIAKQIADLIRAKEALGEMAVLGLATGSSPIAVYKELVRMHKDENLSFRNVITFNLDEYYPMAQGSAQSYVHFMHEHLFRYIDILPENVNIPNGQIPVDEIHQYCLDYENKIKVAGGIDIQLLGIGRTGHIGFNEPGSPFHSITRMVKLDPLTIADATKDFIKAEFVPVRAITMGMSTIMKSRKIIMMAWGEGKARIVKQMVEGEITEMLPASVLQRHPQIEVFLDQWAALELAQVKTPWLVGFCNWNEQLIKKAVIWLSQRTQKPILKLTNEDYKENGLADLLRHAGTAYKVNIDIYNKLQKTITGWPGGKQHSIDVSRPERSDPFPKRSLIFSPHPDDDVISMGGTLLRLVDQGHDVHVAYQTSGNIAVFDDDALRFSSFLLDFSKSLDLVPKRFEAIHQHVVHYLNDKHPGGEDSPTIQLIKGLIRKGEAEAGCRFCGVKEKNVHFLNLPFYETGKVKKNPLGEADIRYVVNLLEKIKPHQIFAAGDLRDPHGTHRVCLDAIFAAIERLKDRPWMKDCYLWLYRGAWQEWDIEDIDMAIPISPEELTRKRSAIFKHQSQKDSPVFPGEDKREFWQRSEARNRNTARCYDKLGFAEYEAIEAFKRYIF